jgi:V/A-type H+-transporting ATPase subunit I
MIIGDAGYGAVYFIVTFLAQLKFGRKMKDKKVFFLFYLFSSCAIIWGSLTGTFFGQQWIIAKGFSPLVPLLNEAKFVMSFCFLLGAVQLSLAHVWQAISKLPSFKALQDIGFICLLWAGFFLAKMFIVGDPFPHFGKWLIWAGVLLVIFFSNPQKNIAKGVAEGLGVLALGAMGNFGDVVSYIRLFAVGLAGVAVADSVNNLAAGAAGSALAQAAIVAVGHTINIVLGPISVLVHGVRLNVLEFSLLHGNVTWSGLAYKPLKE